MEGGNQLLHSQQTAIGPIPSQLNSVHTPKAYA